MKIHRLLISSVLILSTIQFIAQPIPAPMKIEGRRKYSLIVHEGNDSIVSEFNRGLDANRGNRSFLTDMADMYRSTFSGKAISAATGLVELGFNAIVKASESNRPKWEKAVANESTFVRNLPMQREILDFYKNPSQEGPLDPSDLYFHGFGCRQVIEIPDGDGNIEEQEVFYLSCNVRTDSLGLMRMLNHSKFEVFVDSLRFNYAICDLPNDSLGVNSESRIGFDFAKRSDLKFNVKATITSSWINQAMQVYDDVTLGTFDITAEIDPNQLEDGIFTYSAKDKNSLKKVNVRGDCFLVPRSYVGSTDMKNSQDSWGTGQYKVDMQISETCRINPEYYLKDGKWDKKAWGPEWKLIKSRKKGDSVWKQILETIGVQYVGNNWVTTLIEPAKTVLINYQTNGITKLINGASSSMPTMMSGASKGASSNMGNNSGQKETGGSQGGAPGQNSMQKP